VNLPVTGREGSTSDTMLYLQATEAGAYYWKIGDRAVPELITTAELRPRLADYRARSELPRVFIRGDNRATFGATIYAFDSVRLAGIPDVSIETKPSPAGH
jgi:biopolymer transport protein ExbD